ncbi:E3 ubiquitin-protein ligase TRIM21-like [Haplochromis burtoni]|uniref:E3 ubiquitin-protein ligase TRIM21-like n=1 Tax=Haplochromis burtoni TaxID=8153 RepID=UPI0006C9C72C|nr:E3 ubiquitin-protein ligase TRIM21-like [Haplochromis burtoni]
MRRLRDEHLQSGFEKVGVFVDYEEGLVSFYDADHAALIYSFTGCSFTGKLYPFFCPGVNDDDNSAPLIICPVNQFPADHQGLRAAGVHDNLAYALLAPYQHQLKRVQQYAVDVTLDPDTAHPKLILSDDGKQVHCGDKKKCPDNPDRFSEEIVVPGKQSFSSGRFYFEVLVKGKTEWALGVVTESVNRKKKITPSPEKGYWTVGVYENICVAFEDPEVRLPLQSYPDKVGVFVDYEEGLVSFFDADHAALIYSFTGCSFTGKLYPFFCPGVNDDDNSAPLIICPVNQSVRSFSMRKSDQNQVNLII